MSTLELPWRDIDTVLLDMDGTLLDLRFDSYFWLEHVPVRYAQRHGLSVDAAKEELMRRYKAKEGTLEWYSVDYWTGELDLDIALLKREVQHLIDVFPYVVPFLDAVRALGKQVWMVTNAHMHSLSLKMERTRLGGHFDRLINAHELGAPKEDQAFWHRLHERHPFDRKRTLMVDDSLPVLRSAQRYGIAHLVAVHSPDSTLPRKDTQEFQSIGRFKEIMP
jgi:putative hydrolase of the HAD superfamily